MCESDPSKPAAENLIEILSGPLLRNIADASPSSVLGGQAVPSRRSTRRRFPRIDFYYNKYLGHQPTGGELPGHRHPWPELATVLEGKFNAIIGETVYEARQGDWLTLAPRSWHGECCLRTRGAYRLFWFIGLPDGQLGLHQTSYTRALGYQLEDVCRLADVPPDLSQVIRRLAKGRWEPWPRARWELIRLVQWCLSGLTGNAIQPADSHHPLVRQAKKLLEESTGRPPTVKELAELTGLSPNYLSNLFHRFTGQTIRQFRQQQRIKLAQQYLADPSLRVKEIGYRLGFATPQHFTAVFRRATGLTPTAYRRRIGDSD